MADYNGNPAYRGDPIGYNGSRLTPDSRAKSREQQRNAQNCSPLSAIVSHVNFCPAWVNRQGVRGVGGLAEKRGAVARR
jgi:hypothetical protein